MTGADIEKYRFDLAAQALYDFTWNEFCDWYLEISKPVLYGDTYSEARQRGTRYTLLDILEQLLRLLHPFIPFITESVWQSVAPLVLEIKSDDSIMVQAFPEFDENLVDAAAEADMDISPAKELPLLLANASTEDARRSEQFDTLLSKIAKLAKIESLSNENDAPPSATAILGEMKLFVPLAGLIDAAAEIARLNKRLEKADKNLIGLTNKLGNEKFVNSAPEAVVAKTRGQLEDAEKLVTQLKSQIEKMQALV